MMKEALACSVPDKKCQSSAFFAYGATGSGKSFTMGFEKDAAEEGVLQLGMEKIYEKLAALQAEGNPMGNYRVWMSFVELYGRGKDGSEAFDLMAPKRSEKGISKVSYNVLQTKLVYREVKSREEMKQACGEGISKRSTGATGMNDMSSRSHAVVHFSIVTPEYNLEKIGTTISLRSLVNQLEKISETFLG